MVAQHLGQLLEIGEGGFKIIHEHLPIQRQQTQLSALMAGTLDAFSNGLSPPELVITFPD